MTIDGINGKVAALQRAKSSEDVKIWLKELKELADNLVIQSYNLQGEEAVRAWGVQKGIGMALMLDTIYENTANAEARSKIIK